MPRRRQLTGSIVAVATTTLAVAVMLPFRHGLDIAVVALVLVVPVVVGVATGGFLAGVLAVVIGFLGYDVFFIPPYGSLSVGGTDGWSALAVYVVVMVMVSRVVDRLWRAEASSRQDRDDAAHLLDISELLVSDRPTEDLFSIVVDSVRDAFALDAVALLLPPADADGGVVVVAHAGRGLTAAELARFAPTAGEPTSLRMVDGATGSKVIETVVLRVGDRIVGIIGVAGPSLPPHRRELLGAFANHVALAIDRASMRDQRVRLQLLEEVDRHRRYLFGAVSHDLRTPLASIKTSASMLLEHTTGLTAADRHELAGLIESQADRLERVVSNLMDMTRIEAGALVLERNAITLDELFAAAVEALGPRGATVEKALPAEPVAFEGDRTLLVEALGNLLENALRFAPAGTTVDLRGSEHADHVEVRVTDHGPGMPPSDRARLFEVSQQGTHEARRPSAGAGLGLSIARAFVEAHGGRIEIVDAVPGTCVLITLPLTMGPSSLGSDATTGPL